MLTIENKAKFIANQIGKRLKHPENTFAILLNQNHLGIIPWEPQTLSHGYPALICLFAELEDFFPEQGWEHTCHHHILKLVELIESKGVNHLSLFSGIAGICFALHIASKGRNRYQNLLNKLEKLLIDQIFSQYYGSSIITTFSDEYDLISGLSGILTYLFMITESPNLPNHIIQDLLEILIKSTQDVSINGYKLPGWYMPNKNITEQEFSCGIFDVGIAHGITGPLNTLVKAFQKGYKIKQGIYSINKIIDWIKSVRQDIASVKNVWPPTLRWSSAKAHSNEIMSNYYRDSWCYGSPSIALTLLNAAVVLKDPSLYEYAVEALEECCYRIPVGSNLECASFCHGWSGLLTTLHQAYRITKKEIFLNSSRQIADIILDLWDESEPFGYKYIASNKNEEKVLCNNVGLLDGVSGTALSLLDFSAPETRSWVRIFM